MYAGDPRAKGTIKTLARDAVKGGFTVTVTGGARRAEAQEEANRVIKDLKLFLKLDDWIRLSQRDGDSFLEPSINRDRRIVYITRKPTTEMHRNSNRYDLFDDPTKAYWQGDAIYGSQPPPDAIWFAQWQIIHARWDHDEGDRYGQPQFAPSTGAFKKMTEGETDIAVRRKTRAGMKFLHVIEGGSEPDIEAYKERNQDTLNNPFSAIADFFTNKRGAVQAIQGDARLNEIDDVTHHIETWSTASPVPLALLGYGRDINRDVVNDQREQYQDTLPGVTQWTETQILIPVLELQWLLLGIWPEDLEYEIHWAREEKEQATAHEQSAQAAQRRAEATIKVAEAGIKLLANDWPAEIVAEITVRMLHMIDPEIDPRQVLNAIRDMRAAEPDETGRMANIGAMIRNRNGAGQPANGATEKIFRR